MPLSCLVKDRALLALLVGMTSVVALLLLCCRHNDTRTLARADTQLITAEQAQTAARVAVGRARASAGVAEDRAAVVLSQAAAARARARIVGADDLAVSITPNAEPLVVPVPTPVVARMQLDSTAVAALGVLVQKKETVIAAQDLRIRADSVELSARSNAFAALQRVKEPRCGRKCGIVLGVGGMLAAAVAVGQVRRVFR